MTLLQRSASLFGRLVPTATLAASLLAAPASSTWSIVIVDTHTREVAIAGATCLANFDLKEGIPVLRVGSGGACAQSLVDGGTNRIKIWEGFIDGKSPTEILAELAATDGNHHLRQYGIVDMDHAPVKFTGNGAGIAKKAVVGEVGTLKYAIQGNVLTSKQVVLDAEQAILNTPGTLSQKLIEGMLAARDLGGDGRCSCSALAPTSCGAPPPAPFKSAHVAFLVVARLGDVDGICNGGAGCANGQYYLDLNVVGGTGGPDPVFLLRSQHTQWWASMQGVVDHVESAVQASAQSLVADGASSLDVTVQLADVLGAPIGTGGANVAVDALDPASGLTFSAVTDHGNGSYSFQVTAGTEAESAELVITADDGVQVATLAPYLPVRVDPQAALHCGFDEVSAAAGASVPLTVNGPAGAPYVVLGSLSGTSPGLALDIGVLPLNPDPFFQLTLLDPGSSLFGNTLGALDAAGRAEAAFELPAGLLAPAIGLRFDWSAVLLEFFVTPGAPATITNAVGFDLVP